MSKRDDKIDEEINKRLERMNKRSSKRMAEGATYQEAYWPARGIHAFSRSGGWTTRHTPTKVHYRCTVCDKTIATFDRSVHAFRRAAKGKAAVRAHILEAHKDWKPE